MELISVQCPSCGADLPPKAPAGAYKCAYCGKRFELAHARSAHTQEGREVSVETLARELGRATAAGHASPELAAQAARNARRVGCTVASSALLLAVGAATAFFLAQQGGSLPGADSIPGVAELVRATERVLWDDVGGPPQLAKVGGRAAMIGRTRVVLDGDKLYVEAWGLEPTERLWRLGPFGSYSQAYQAVHFAVWGDRVIVSGPGAEVRVFDLQTAQEVRRFELSDKVEQLCRPAGDPDAPLWVLQVDERHHALDLGAGVLTEGPRPAGCPRSHWDAKRQTLEGLGRDAGPDVPGLEIKRVYAAGDTGLALAVKAPGTPIPHAVGFDPKTREVRFDVLLPSVELSSVRPEEIFGGIGGGRVVASYGVGQEGWRVTALDARSGDRLWDVLLRPIFAVDRIDGFVVAQDHVIVIRTSSVEVLRATDGALVGVVGAETYDE
jgi:predicted RNA-binding Zn-ribbon protein involved in translation (DUF1610 family)